MSLIVASAVGCRQWLNMALHVSTIPLGTEVAVVDDVACEVWPRWSFSFIRANRDAIDCRRHCTSWRRFGGGGAETREFISCHTHHHPSVTQRFTSILCCSLIDHALRGTPWSWNTAFVFVMNTPSMPGRVRRIRSFNTQANLLPYTTPFPYL